MLSKYLKYLSITSIVVAGGSYLMVLLSLTILDTWYYGNFIFIGSLSVLLYFLIEGIQHFYLRDN